MSKSRFVLSAICLAACIGVSATASATPLKPRVVNLTPTIRLPFNNESFEDVAGGSTVIVPMAGHDPCVDEGENKVICSDETQSVFGVDEHGSYWKTVQKAGYNNGGLMVDPNTPITTTYTMAVTFSLVEDVTGDYDNYTRVIHPSIGRDAPEHSILYTDCGLYLMATPEFVGYTGEAGIAPGNYCNGVMIGNGARHVDVSEAGSEVITLVLTRDSDDQMCMYEVSSGGAVDRIGNCFSDSLDYIPLVSESQINDGMIGFFMDDNGEWPVSAKIYDIRIWDRSLNINQLDRVYQTPATPKNVKVKRSGTKTQVSWKASTQGPRAGAFVAEAFTSESGDELAGSCTSRGNNCKMTLSEGTYWISVKSRNGDGFSAPSTRISYVVQPRAR